MIDAVALYPISVRGGAAGECKGWVDLNSCAEDAICSTCEANLLIGMSNLTQSRDGVGISYSMMLSEFSSTHMVVAVCGSYQLRTDFEAFTSAECFIRHCNLVQYEGPGTQLFVRFQSAVKKGAFKPECCAAQLQKN